MKRRTILITIDCLRQDHLEIYGYPLNVAPNLLKFSKKSIIFENAIANGPNTPPSFYSIFTSTIPTLSGIYAPLPLNKKSFSEILYANGINTCAVHSNPHLGKNCNYDKGFKYFFDVYENPPYELKKKISKKGKNIFKILDIKGKIIIIRNKIFKIFKINQRISQVKKKKIKFPYSNARIITSEAIKWLEKNYNSNFFLWIHYMDVHRPYYPSNDFIKKLSDEKVSDSLKIYINSLYDNYKNNPDFFNKITDNDVKLVNLLYDAEILNVDHYLGIFFTFLKKLNIYDKINIIITADHGQALFDHNQLSHDASLYDELLRIPLIIKIRDSSIKSRRIFEQVELIDISQTILDLFDLPQEKTFMGHSLIPLIKKNKHYTHPKYSISALYHANGKMFTAFRKKIQLYKLLISCRTLNWKLIYDNREKKSKLFNLKEDPNELYNLINEKREEVIFIKNQLFDKIKSYIKDYDLEKKKIKEIIKRDSLKFI
ncbi:MAG: sulfatase-like hydrolase/transferase [Promethearchaeota archaeon]